MDMKMNLKVTMHIDKNILKLEKRQNFVSLLLFLKF